MLDLARLERIKLRTTPPGQVLVANLGLALDFRFPRRTEIVLEGADQLPDRNVILAMNHTDRFNYWPLQYQLYREGLGFTATWVKGKYYESRFVGWFMDMCNNIPLPSRGYVIASEFRLRAGRAPTRDEYRALRDRVDDRCTATAAPPEGASDELVSALGDADFLGGVEATFERMMVEVVRLSRQAYDELNLHLLVFPEGTRSIRLGRGRTGLAQMAHALGATIVPVGCNGSDRLYPSDSPFSKGGRVVYRFGPSIRVDDPTLADLAVPRDVLPFSREASARYGDRYQALTDRVMSAIAELLDPEYLPSEDEVQGDGVDRFLD